jgi:hypothetical protein
MSRKLLLLDAGLVALVVASGFQFRAEWKRHKERERATLNRPVKPVSVPALPAIPRQPDVVPNNYFKIAQQMLFDRSRNSDVAPPPPPPPPPPEPMPPLPVYHGMMSLGSTGPIAILSVTAAAPHQGIHPGEQIGQFTLVDVNSNGITLEWKGQRIYKDADELSNRAGGSGPQEAAPVAETRTAAPLPAAAAPPAAPPKAGPGEETAFGNRICRMDDGVAENAVVDGYRKVVHVTPFGRSCTYERAQ